ncbi:hypothetical protein ACSSV4_002378 [Roseovarius sp. MBR-154]
MKLHLIPDMTTDEEAEAILEQDLFNLDFTQFRPLDRNRQNDPAGEREGDPCNATQTPRHPRA